MLETVDTCNPVKVTLTQELRHPRVFLPSSNFLWLPPPRHPRGYRTIRRQMVKSDACMVLWEKGITTNIKALSLETIQVCRAGISLYAKSMHVFMVHVSSDYCHPTLGSVFRKRSYVEGWQAEGIYSNVKSDYSLGNRLGLTAASSRSGRLES